MTRSLPIAVVAALIGLVALCSASAAAHSASDAYLTLESAAPESAATTNKASTDKVVVHGQWDVALRDLDFVLKLDDDGDGNITWAELRRHQRQIAEYAYANLSFGSGGVPCVIVPTRQLVDGHADGAYAALFFDVACAKPTARLTLAYRMFFALDLSHRGILVFRSGSNVATSLLSPERAKIDLQR